MIDREEQEEQPITPGYLIVHSIGVLVAGLGWYWRFLRNKPLGGISALIILALIIIAIFGPLLIAPYDPDQLFPTKDPPAPQIQAPKIASASVTLQSFTTVDFCNANAGACIESDGELRFFEVRKRNLATKEYCDAVPGSCLIEEFPDGDVQYSVGSNTTTLEFCNANPGQCVTFTEEECAEEGDFCHIAPDGARYELVEVKTEANESPNLNHWLGTDNLGRSVLSRAIYGARISLYVGILAVAISTGTGTVIGLVTGFFEGPLDFVVQRFIDALQAFPALILALGIIAIKGPSIQNALFVIAVVLIPTTARVVRGTVLSLKQNPYVEASRALGASNYRVMFRHILPNAMAPVIVQASILLGATIIFEASLSFLGAGAKPTDPSWGAMISGNAGSGVNAIHDYEQFPWLAITPAILISLSVLSFNLLGDAVRDVLDPRLRGGGGRLR